MSQRVRSAVCADAPAISKLVNSVYRGDTRAQGWTTEAHLITGDRITTAQVETIIADLKQVILVLESNDKKIIGCVELKNQDTYAYLGMLSVDAHIQARGIGAQILAGAEEFVKKEWGVHIIKMWVLTIRTELISWYVRKGYDVSPERIPYSSLGDEAGQPLVASLEFAILQKKI